MNKILYLIILPLLVLIGAGCTVSACDGGGGNEPVDHKNEKPSANKNLFDFTVKDIDGDSINFSKFKGQGKQILIVNTASECGFTRQYEGLEELYQKEKEDLAIVGFPANNFGGQEPGSDEEIKKFCKKNYGVSFPMASKVSVKGEDQHKLFQWLTTEENPDFTGDIKWNFEKFLIDENGNLIHRFRSLAKPTGRKITKALEKS